MKKRILSVLLVIALLVTVGIVAAQAENPGQSIIDAASELSLPYTAEGETPVAITDQGECPICGTIPGNGGWKPLSSVTANSALGAGGIHHWYMDKAEIETAYTYNNGGGTAHVFLNNATLKSSGDFVFSSGNTLCVFGNGNVISTKTDGSTNKGCALRAGGVEINIYGGTYSATSNSAVVAWNTTAKTNIYGGTFTSTGSYYALHDAGGTINIYGGDFEAQQSNGRSVFAEDKSFVVEEKYNLTICGGTFEGKIKSDKGTVTIEDGANVPEIEVTAGYLNVNGGEITTATVTKAALSLSGNPEITTLDLTGATTLPATISDLEEGASIGVKVAAGAVVANNLTADDAKYFTFIGDALYEMAVDESGNLTTATKSFDSADEIMDYANNHMDFSVSTTQYCPECKATVSWSKLAAPGSNYIINGGGADPKHFYVPDEGLVTTYGMKNGAGTRNSHIHLNNSSIEVTNGDYAFSDYGTIVLMGQGTVTQKGTGAVLKSGGNNMKIYGGTYTATADCKYALEVRSATSTWDIYGGTFSGGNTAVMGVTNATGTLNIHGGTFNGAVAATTGTTTISGGEMTAVDATGGALTVSGGEITTATVTKATLSLTGAPEITTLDLTAATTLPITVTDMTAGASVGLNVAAGTTITDGNDADYIGYFSVPVQDPMNVFTTDDNGALVYIARTFDTPEEIADYANNHMSFEKGLANDTAVTAFCPICKKDVTWRARTSGGNVNLGGDKHLFFTAETLTLTSRILTGSGATHLFLNGVTINANHDSGVFYSDSTDNSYGDIGFSVLGNATINQLNDEGFGMYANGEGQFNVYGGTWNATNMFNCIEEISGITVYGGTFNGDSNWNAGTLKLLGGDFDGTIKLANIWAANKGNAVIENDIDGVSIDLNTRQNVTVNGNGETYILDTNAKANVNEATVYYGAATINNPNAVAADSYILLAEEDGTKSAHYYELKLSGVALKNKNDKVGLYYKGAWTMDNRLKEAAEVGVVLNMNNRPTANFYNEYLEARANGNTGHKNFFHSYAGDSVVNGADKTSVLMDGILKTSREATANDTAGQTKIYAAAYIMIPELDEEGEIIGGEIYVSAPRADGLDQLSVYDVLAKIQAKNGEEALTAFYTEWNQYSNVESIVATLIGA